MSSVFSFSARLATEPRKPTHSELLDQHRLRRLRCDPHSIIRRHLASLPIIWIFGRSLTPRFKCRHLGLRPDSIQPSDFQRLLARVRSQRRECVLCERGTIRHPRRFITVRLAVTFSTTCSCRRVLCGIRDRKRRDQRWFTATRPTQTSHRSGFGVKEFARFGPAASSNYHDGGFLICLRSSARSVMCKLTYQPTKITFRLLAQLSALALPFLSALQE